MRIGGCRLQREGAALRVEFDETFVPHARTSKCDQLDLPCASTGRKWRGGRGWGRGETEIGQERRKGSAWQARRKRRGRGSRGLEQRKR